MSDEQERRDEQAQAAQLADYLEGGQVEVNSEDAETIALLRQAANGPPELETSKTDALWADIEGRVNEGRSSPWPLWTYFAAAAAALVLLLYPAQPEPLPPGPDVADFDKAIKALDPAFGPPGQRLQAFDDLARKSRQRLISEIQR